jgi:hypothetical protein
LIKVSINIPTASSSFGVNKNLSANLSGINRQMKKGKARAAGVDFTSQRRPSPKTWHAVNRCIFTGVEKQNNT